jgi:hypothetical protein
MKKFMKCAIVVAITGVFMMGTAWAWNDVEHVTVAPNGKGDAAIFPVYVAFSGCETKLEVINTSATFSVVAKVVVRSPQYSQELLDFFIYLSPTDVWTGYLNYGPQGARVYSTDDSVHPGTRATGPEAGWATELDPMDVSLVDLACDINDMGYVEIVEAWHCNAGLCAGLPPVDKDDIEAEWLAQTNCASDTGTLNSLAFHYEVNITPAYSAAERAVCLRDYDVTDVLTLGAETFLGSSAGSASRNSICEVEAVLAKDLIAMPYYAANSSYLTFHFMTFPTKYTAISPLCVINSVRSPFFEQNADVDYCIPFGLYWFDLEENSPTCPGAYSPVPESAIYRFCWELNMVDPEVLGVGYDEGWMNYVFDYSTTCNPESAPAAVPALISFAGAPVIPVVCTFEGTGMSLMTGAWSDGDVYYGDILEPYYHYGPFPN